MIERWDGFTYPFDGILFTRTRTDSLSTDSNSFTAFCNSRVGESISSDSADIILGNSVITSQGIKSFSVGKSVFVVAKARCKGFVGVGVCCQG